jgi:hypothetical protein
MKNIDLSKKPFGYAKTMHSYGIILSVISFPLDKS